MLDNIVWSIVLAAVFYFIGGYPLPTAFGLVLFISVLAISSDSGKG